MSSSLQQIFDSYISYLKAEKNASPYTIRNYSTDLLDFFNFLYTRRVSTLTDITRPVLRTYLSSLVDRRFVKGSIARKQSAVRSFLRYLLREGVIEQSPIPVRRQRGQKLDAFSVKLDKRLPSFLSAEDAAEFVESPEVSHRKIRNQALLELVYAAWLRDRAVLELLYAAGLRVSEICRLDLTDISLDRREVQVFGKGSKERIALFGEPAAKALQEYLAQGRPPLLQKKNNNALFLSAGGRRITVRRVQKIVQKYGHKLGKRVHPHMLRHTFATHLLDGGADLKVVQELLGHARLSSTQIYSHITKAQARKVYLAAHPLAAKKTEPNEPENPE